VGMGKMVGKNVGMAKKVVRSVGMGKRVVRSVGMEKSPYYLCFLIQKIQLE